MTTQSNTHNSAPMLILATVVLTAAISTTTHAVVTICKHILPSLLTDLSTLISWV
jgi:hypothetical protein